MALFLISVFLHFLSRFPDSGTKVFISNKKAQPEPPTGQNSSKAAFAGATKVDYSVETIERIIRRENRENNRDK